ncbi:helix-turn-helix transcriptional regulator [Janibacter cremeus]|uniref:DNA-binding CsgD family transcriptional regulator n=1 Tax=Janibacter cremeus TaxID=1285192 RepID=A0A852VPD0_9MICO|nr:helix-turn-helix transcriptional regulator [Janibacter cremeus]NYF97320.1 DNA-binding CsgD family transcriptional regulator [Janibacter cremeus]
MTRTNADAWLPTSLIDDIETVLNDSAPHTVVLGRAGDGQSVVAHLLAERMVDDTGPQDVLVLEGDDLGGEDAHDRVRQLAGRGARLVVVPLIKTPAVPKELLASCSTLRLRPWSEQEVAEYLEHCHDVVPEDELVRSLAEATGGHPAYIRHFASLRHSPVEPSPVLDPALWEHALDRQMTTLDPTALTLVDELAIGFRVHTAPLAPSLAESDRRDRLVEELDHHALLGGDGELLPLVRITVRSGMPVHRIMRIGHAVVEGISDPTPHAGVIEELVAGGARCERLVDITRDLGDSELQSSPEMALAWYDRSQASGASPSHLASRRAEALLRIGDVDAAAHTCDRMLASGHDVDLDRAVSTAIVAHVERGLASQARALALWASSALGTVPAVDLLAARQAAGDPAQNDVPEDTGAATATAAGAGAPTLGKMAARTAYQGLQDSLTGATADAVGQLVKAAHLLPPAPSALSPYPISLVAGWAALHLGDSATARAVAERARPSLRPHIVQRELLLGWAALWQGNPPGARDHADRAASGLHDSQLRNRLVLAGLRSGIARRTTDEAAAVHAWTDATQCLGRVEPDLFMLLALGELNIAAVRMHQAEVLTADLDRAHELLENLGSPPLWSTPLNWSSVQAAILANQPAAIAPHATALLHAAEHHPFAARLASAGKAWMHVLARNVDPAEVHSAVIGLTRVGQAWDGARLAAHAAARCEDPREAAALRELARSLRDPDQDRGESAVGQSVPGSVLLSEREVEVVRLVLDGKTYREVGEMLYLSPRTVEHHMARIRQRSGAQTRSELLERLQLTLRQAS